MPARSRPRLAAAAALLAVLVVLALPALAHAAPDEFVEARARGWFWAYLSVFGAGVLTSLTPCVYPMIPIVMGIFGARGKDVSRGRAFGLASMYVAGMGVMYSALGIAVALAGRQFGSLLSNPWFVFPIVGFYALLAASMFGAFELNLPTSLQTRLSTVGGRGVGGAFAMGLVGGLTAAPCTGPMLLGILTYVATTKNVLIGWSLLFTFAIGMGVLFFALALFAISLPKSGSWMDAVKTVAGIALLDMGIYFMRPVVPQLAALVDVSWQFLVASLGVAVVGLAVGALHLSFHGSWAQRLRKGVGVVLVTLGVGGVINYTLTPKLKPGWRVRCADDVTEAQRAESRCFVDESTVLAEAKQAGAPVLMDFGAEWCLPCKKYESDVFADPRVHAAIEARYVAIKFDVTKDTDADRAVQERWGAQSLPTVIILNPDGSERRRFAEPIPSPEEFLDALNAAAETASAGR